MTLAPNTRPADWPEIAPDRLARAIRTAGPDGCRVALIGLPDDLGVRMNGGRPGARFGPDAFRAALARFGTGFDAHREGPIEIGVYDAGDVVPARGEGEPALRETHDRITQAVLAVHRAGLLPVCIGGGHDLTYPSARALASHTGQRIGGVNIDAHLDVRETAGSGMPFRALIEGGQLDAKRFTVHGAGRFTNAHKHVEFLRARGGSLDTIDRVLSGEAPFARALERAGAPAFVTIDLDAIDASQAPGVSAVNPMGLSVAPACDAARLAGAAPSVRHFDLMELCPVHDEPAWDDRVRAPGRTARIAALLFLHFLAGLRERRWE